MGSAPRAAGLDETDEDEAPLPDYSTMRPMCGESEFAALLDTLVADWAPRLFAIVQEYGIRADGEIVAWGMAFEDHAHTVSIDSTMRVRTATAESARQMFVHGDDVSRARLVWFNADAAGPPDDDL